MAIKKIFVLCLGISRFPETTTSCEYLTGSAWGKQMSAVPPGALLYPCPKCSSCLFFVSRALVEQGIPIMHHFLEPYFIIFFFWFQELWVIEFCPREVPAH